MTNISTNMANREVMDLIFENYSTGDPFLNLDFANTSTTELTGESVFAYGGKGHSKRVSFSGEKGGTITIETQMQSAKLWQMITGGDLKKTAKYVKRVQATAASGVITLDEAPAAGTITNVYKADDDCGEKLDCTVADKTITLTDSSVTDVIVYYTRELATGVQVINVKSTSFPKAFKVTGDTYYRTDDDDILVAKMVAYKCVPQSNISLGFSNNGDPASITITCDLMSDKNDNIIDLIIEDGE